MTNFADRPDSHSGDVHRAADAIVREIEGNILSGDLSEGVALPAERLLMERFGASRTVVREAIATLGSRGLLEVRARHRPIVRQPGYDTALDAMGDIVRLLLSQGGGVRTLYDSRIFVERALVREAAISAGKENIAELRAALDANRASIADSHAFYLSDSAFHGVFYTVPDNPVFPALHKAYTTWLAPHWEKMPVSPERNLINLQSHEAIVDAVLERDPDAAETALAAHLEMAWGQVRVTFSDSDP